MLPGFYPFAEETICPHCCELVETKDGVGVWVDGVPVGLAHEWCVDEEGVVTVTLKGNEL